MPRKPDLDTWLQQGVDPTTRTIYLGSEDIDAAAAERAIKALHVLDTTEGPIYVKLISWGGSWSYGMAIYDAITACRNEVTAIGYGILASMGAIIFQAADVRALMPNAMMMVHYGDDHVDGHALDVQRYAAHAKMLRERFETLMLTRIQQRRKMTLAQFRARFAFDVWLEPADAVALGLADAVLGGDAE